MFFMGIRVDRLKRERKGVRYYSGNGDERFETRLYNDSSKEYWNKSSGKWVKRSFKNYIDEHEIATSEIVDLKEYNFPVFEERLSHQPYPLPEVLDFSEKIKKADGVIIVTPEYNGGYPASLKNVVDLLYDEWRRKPIAISTVSNGVFGGAQVITALQFTFFKIRAWVVPAMCPMPKAQVS